MGVQMMPPGFEARGEVRHGAIIAGFWAFVE